MTTRKHAFYGILALVSLLGLGITQSASAATLNWVELPNEGGVHFSATGMPFPYPIIINNDVPGSETYHVSSPIVPPGYVPDAIASHIGISRTASYYLFNILERPGGPISDQVYVHQFIPAFTVIDFISDPSNFVDLAPTATVVEGGGLQVVGTYLNDRGERVFLRVNSAADTPDAGSTLPLLGFALAGLGILRRKLRC
jgi:protein with PEP-CTERM/exosortase system signal